MRNDTKQIRQSVPLASSSIHLKPHVLSLHSLALFNACSSESDAETCPFMSLNDPEGKAFPNTPPALDSISNNNDNSSVISWIKSYAKPRPSPVSMPNNNNHNNRTTKNTVSSPPIQISASTLFRRFRKSISKQSSCEDSDSDCEEEENTRCMSSWESTSSLTNAIHRQRDLIDRNRRSRLRYGFSSIDSVFPDVDVEVELNSTDEENDDHEFETPTNRTRGSVSNVAQRWEITETEAAELMQNVEDHNSNAIWPEEEQDSDSDSDDRDTCVDLIFSFDSVDEDFEESSL